MQSTVQGNEKQSMPLASKKLLAFLVFFGISGILGFLCLLIPGSIWAIRGDPTGSGSGYFIAGLLFFGPFVATPAGLLAAFVALRMTNQILQATHRSRSDNVRFLVATIVSALLGIVLTWFILFLIFFTINLFIPEVQP